MIASPAAFLLGTLPKRCQCDGECSFVIFFLLFCSEKLRSLKTINNNTSVNKLILTPKAAMNVLSPSFLLTYAVATTIILPVVILSTSMDGQSSSHYYVDSSATGVCHSSNNDDGTIPVRREIFGGDKIIDITHQYQPGIPLWGSDAGLSDDFLQLQHSTKNGSESNNSEMKLSVHAGTHVDAPGHLFDHYFDSGFDVDTLDLDVLNGMSSHLCFSPELKKKKINISGRIYLFDLYFDRSSITH